ncbi:MAG: copper chaperone PCu(A)C [Burkholderiaceae bacterium]
MRISPREQNAAERTGKTTRRELIRWTVATLASALAGLVLAGPAAPDLVVSDAWARPTVPGQDVGAAYFSISSVRDSTLIEVQSDVAASVQIHRMSADGDVMRMRQLDRLPLPAGQTVRLAPGGVHLMMMQLKRPLRIGDTVTLSLTLVQRDGSQSTARVFAPVRGSPPAQR